MSEKNSPEVKVYTPTQDRADTATLSEFEEELNTDRKLRTEVQVRVRQEVVRNPDISGEELSAAVQEILGEYRGDYDGRYEFIEGVISEYLYRHKIIKDLREQNTNGSRILMDQNLFKEVFGFEARGKIEIIEGPVTLYFKCFDYGDYRDIFTGVHISKTTEDEIEDEINETSRIAKSSGGAMLADSLMAISGLQGMILIENAESVGDQSEDIYRHEETHAWNSLFMSYGLIWDEETLIWHLDFDSSDPNSYYESLFIQFLESSRVWELVKDEIFAYTKSHDYPSWTFFSLTKLRQQGGIYDYLADLKDELVDHSVNWSRERKLAMLKALNDVFVKRYKDTIEEGLEAMSRLTREFNLTADKAIAILRYRHLGEWPDVVEEYNRFHNANAYKEYRSAMDEYTDRLEKLTKKSKTGGLEDIKKTID